MSLHVLSPGLLTTVQDTGRPGHAAFGVGSAGAADPVALRLANLLVGNPPEQNAAGLEFTLRGPRLHFDQDTLVALTGAAIDARCDDEIVPTWRPVRLRAGSELAFGGMRHGTRAYLAVAGGIDVAAVLGSRSTDVNAGLGALSQPVAAGDILSHPAVPAALCCRLGRLLEREPRRRIAADTWSLDPAPWFDRHIDRPIRVIAGTHFDLLDGASQRALFGTEFRIGTDSNRVGYRLEGAPLHLREPLEAISAGVVPGTVQLPPGGMPIVLGVEAPTTGGYPRIAHVIAVDLPRLAQRRPGDPVRFAQTDLADAQMRYLERERALRRIGSHLRERLRQT